MRPLLTVLCLLYLNSSLPAQIYLIPGASEQAEWVFPIWFEDAAGVIDTIWMGYDSEAGNSDAFDEQFNEWQKIDTSKFTVVIWPGSFSPYSTLSLDSAYKAAIVGGTINISVGFLKGLMPITMYWDSNLFNSENLPFVAPPDPFPIAFGQIDCGAAEPPYINCPSAFDDQPLTMTDIELPGILYPVTSPHIFDGSGIDPYATPQSSLGYFNISILETNEIITAIANPDKNDYIIFPNPAIDQVSIGSFNEIGILNIIDIYGNPVFSKRINSVINIDCKNWYPGVYIIMFNNEFINKLLIY